jgi:hypothetical protein
MLTPYVYAALAHERYQRFLTEAETGRRARQARLHRRQADRSGARRSPRRRRPVWLQSGRSGLLGHWPRSAVTGRPVVLRDGSAVLIRPVRPVDAPLLADGFARLSARSRQLRFLTQKKELSPAELCYFTDVDHHDHEALSSSDDPAGRLPESAAITIVTETRPTTARSSPDRLSFYDTYSGWAQQGTAQAWSCPLGTE